MRIQSKNHWHGNRSFDKARGQESTSATNLTVQKPAIAASSQSKSKLKAFQFEGDRSVDGQKDSEKENKPLPMTENVDPVKKQRSPGKSGPDGSKDRRTDGRETNFNLPPSTPAMRLPLAELIGNAEDALRLPLPKEDSPEEQLGWIPNSSNSALTPGQRRKRAHSSSPLASSQNETSAHFALREPLDLQNLQQSLKTPHADPATDLWNRYYTMRNANETPSGAKAPLFAHLLDDSSPRSFARTPGGSVGGLRRWASCGMEWPTSKAKRRRTNGAVREQPADILESRETAKEHLVKVSKVGMLVEQMQATLAQPMSKRPADAPSSSSPLPDKGVFGDGPEISPSHYRNIHEPQARHTTQDDNDESLVQAIQSQTLSDRHGRHVSDRQESANDVILPTDSASQAPPKTPQELVRLETIEEMFDDFDDFDDFDEFEDAGDITAEDLDNAVPLFDNTLDHHATVTATEVPNRPDHFSQPSIPTPGHNERLVDAVQNASQSEDDEFGGSDLDDDQFAAAEVAATQAYNASTATQGSVRISNLSQT